MNKNIKLTTIKIETKFKDVLLKGELEYWAKDFRVRLIEPFLKHGCGSHLQYAVPVKFVFKKSDNPTCIEVPLEKRAIEILKQVYQNSLSSK